MTEMPFRPGDPAWVECLVPHKKTMAPAELLARWRVAHGLSDPNPFPRMRLFRRG